MFERTLGVVCGLAVAAACSAQAPATVGAPVKHFRINFTISSGTSQPAQNFSIEVPVAPDHAGVASLRLESGLAGDAIAHSLSVQCSEVHESAKGLGLKISVKSDSEAPPRPGINEPIVQERVFERKVDVALNTPTVITGVAEQAVSLGNAGSEPSAPRAAAQPQITVTATEL